MDFAQFYQQGGVLMHGVTVCSLVAAGGLVAGIRARRKGAALNGLPFVVGMAKGAMLIGLLGLVFGLMELAAALQTVPADLWLNAAMRGGKITLHPVAFALMCATPILLAHTILTAGKRTAPQ